MNFQAWFVSPINQRSKENPMKWIVEGAVGSG